jgi:phenylalanyl-tRNA synthetase beta chain
MPKTNYKETKDDINKHFSLEVNTDNCTFYNAKMVTGVKIKESPDFIKNRLVAAGMRSIKGNHRRVYTC